VSDRRISLIDSLRGIAALVVVFHHLQVVFLDASVMLGMADWVRTLIMAISDLNVEAVLLFFVISGFSITYSSRRYRFDSSQHWRVYITKRLRRLLPLYWASLILALMIGLMRGVASQSEFSALTLLGNFVFLQSPATVSGNWFAPYGQNYPLWSLSFEMFFYLVFPILAWLGLGSDDGRPWQRYLTDSLAVLLSLAGLLIQQWSPNPVALFASHYLIWHLGLVLARQHLSERNDRLLTGVAAFVGVVILTLVLEKMPSATINNLRTGLAMFVIWQIATVINRDWTLIHWIERGINTLFLQLGLISYAIYLFHYPIMHWVKSWQWSLSISITITMILTIILSWSAERYSRRFYASPTDPKQSGQAT